MLFYFLLLGRQPGVLMVEGLTTSVLYYLHINITPTCDGVNGKIIFPSDRAVPLGQSHCSLPLCLVTSLWLTTSH